MLTSTLSGNSTVYSGGGIYNYHGKLMVQTSTLSGNRAGAGGGIANESGTAFKVYNSTLSGNRAGNGGGGILNYGTWLDLMHTIIANSPEGGDCVLISGGGGWATSGYGLIESTGVNACGLNSDYFTIVGVDPLLGPLADNGGATQTFALLPGSPAIDAGWSTGAPDQRGVVRPQGAACDIGAFESRGFTLTNSGGDNQHTVINTAFANPLTVTLTETDGPALPGVLITFIPPGSGASAVLSSGTATTNGSGIASVTATANGAAGPYNINASAADGMPNVAFALTNDKAGAMVALSDLTHEYDGTPKSATVTTSPVGLAYTVTYDGSPTPPTAVGVYTVVATVTDLNYQGSANGTFTIQDTTAPTVIVPADITAEATGATGAVVTFVVTATDMVDGALTPSCTPASGSTFPLGAQVTAGHRHGGQRRRLPDHGPGHAGRRHCPGGHHQEATGPTGAIVASRDGDRPGGRTLTPPAPFRHLPAGPTVTCTATDTAATPGPGLSDHGPGHDPAFPALVHPAEPGHLSHQRRYAGFPGQLQRGGPEPARRDSRLRGGRDDNRHGCRRGGGRCPNLRRHGVGRRPGWLQWDGRREPGCRTEHHGRRRQCAAAR